MPVRATMCAAPTAGPSAVCSPGEQWPSPRRNCLIQSWWVPGLVPTSAPRRWRTVFGSPYRVIVAKEVQEPILQGEQRVDVRSALRIGCGGVKVVAAGMVIAVGGAGVAAGGGVQGAVGRAGEQAGAGAARHRGLGARRAPVLEEP